MMKDNRMTEYPCKECDMVFSKKSKYNRHIIVHTGERLFKCEVCGKALTRKDKLNAHLLLHGENPFKCEHCEASFPRAKQLRNHVKTSHVVIKNAQEGESILYECQECDKVYNRRDLFMRHKNVHLPEKPFVCDICHKGFTRKDKMNTHRKIHDREVESCTNSKVKQKASVAKKKEDTRKQYPCPSCTWSCYYPSMLESHVRSHNVELPFKCDSCAKTFYLDVNLKSHAHTEEYRPFSCDECPKSYQHRTTLQVHKKKVHKTLASLQDPADHSDLAGVQGLDNAFMDTESDNEGVMEHSFIPEVVSLQDSVEDDSLQDSVEENSFQESVEEDSLQDSVEEDLVPTDYVEILSEYSESLHGNNDEKVGNQNKNISFLYDPHCMPKKKSRRKKEHKIEIGENVETCFDCLEPLEGPETNYRFDTKDGSDLVFCVCGSKYRFKTKGVPKSVKLY